MPKVNPEESKKEYINRCIPVLIDEGKSQNQAVAICHSMWEKRNESVINKINAFLNEKAMMKRTSKGFIFKTKKDDTGHMHNLTVDDEGTGKTTSTINLNRKSTTSNHIHKVFEWKIQPANGHIHAIEE